MFHVAGSTIVLCRLCRYIHLVNRASNFHRTRLVKQTLVALHIVHIATGEFASLS